MAESIINTELPPALEVSREVALSIDVAVTQVSESGAKEKKHRRRSRTCKGPRLNIWDVPEFLPGARPGASAVQKAYLEKRSVSVFKYDKSMDELEMLESDRRAEVMLSEQLETQLSTLADMFEESVEFDIIQDIYLINNCEMDLTINQLIQLIEYNNLSKNNYLFKIECFPKISNLENEWELVNSDDVCCSNFEYIPSFSQIVKNSF